MKQTVAVLLLFGAVCLIGCTALDRPGSDTESACVTTAEAESDRTPTGTQSDYTNRY